MREVGHRRESSRARRLGAWCDQRAGDRIAVGAGRPVAPTPPAPPPPAPVAAQTVPTPAAPPAVAAAASTPVPAPAAPAPAPPPPEAVASDAGAPDAAPPVEGTPHLASPENLPPDTTLTPVDPQRSRGLTYLRELWHAVRTQEVSGEDALLLLTQRPLDPNATPPPGMSANPTPPQPATAPAPAGEPPAPAAAPAP
ncbi:hypothetical protein [Mycolicibacterium holsaticum]|uniref:hypothetical protein n=1 Tax=Mycolicibacterium holsaticum TaxID=152142 RepID=UPI00223D8424|nr:hypothetical protein [Mycolicibacterium holsaticum]